MKKYSARKPIVLYWVLALALTLPLLLPFWLIDEPLGVVIYFVGFYIYTRIAVTFVTGVTIMPSLWKELDAEKFGAIISAKPFLANYSYKLNFYLATGDYQSAYNIIHSVLLQHKNINQQVYGRLLLCRVCLERGDYEGVKDNVAEIDNYLKCNTTIKLSKQNKVAYAFYRAFSDADYSAACTIVENGINKYSKKKNRDYFVVMRQYQLAIVKRMQGNTDEAVALFEDIEKKSPKLVFSALSRKQLDIISGTIKEETPIRLEITEKNPIKSNKVSRVLPRIIIIIFCVCLALAIFTSIMKK